MVSEGTDFESLIPPAERSDKISVRKTTFRDIETDLYRRSNHPASTG
jgi:hypothetical protein